MDMRTDLSGFVQINFVADDDEGEVFGLVLGVVIDKEIISPRFERLERFRIGHIIYQNTTVGAAVVRRANRMKHFLSRCIPNLTINNECYKFIRPKLYLSTYCKIQSMIRGGLNVIDLFFE
jgi:hypothetical protein